jgi:hypothetical protein
MAFFANKIRFYKKLYVIENVGLQIRNQHT